MFFSVLIPVYNVEKYLSECIDSVLNQTEQDFEIILVNDGSIDNSGLICDKYANEHIQNIRVIHQDNKGLLLTRRTGIKNAKGDYLVFLDSDDMLEKEALHYIKQVIKKYTCDMVCFNFSRYKDFSSAKTSLPFENEEIFTGDLKKKLYDVICSSSIFNNLCNKVVKREIVDADFEYDKYKFIKNGEDLLQLLPIVTNAKKIIYLKKAMYYYRSNPNSITRTFQKDHYKSIKTINLMLIKYLSMWYVDYDSDIIYKRHLRSIYSIIASLNNLKNTDKEYKNIKNYLFAITNDDFAKKCFNECEMRELKLKECIILYLLFHNKTDNILTLLKYYHKIESCIGTVKNAN